MDTGIKKYIKIAIILIGISPLVVLSFRRNQSLDIIKESIIEDQVDTVGEIFDNCKAIKNLKWGFEVIELVEALDRDPLAPKYYDYDEYEDEGDDYYEYTYSHDDEYVVASFNMCTEDKGVSRIQKIYFEVEDKKAYIVKMVSYYDKILFDGSLEYTKENINPKNTYNYFIKEFAGNGEGNLKLINCSDVDEEKVKENLARRKKEAIKAWKDKLKAEREAHALEYKRKQMKEKYGYMFKK